MEFTVHLFSMWVQQTTKLIWSYKEVHHEWKANKEVLSSDRVQSFSNSKHIQAKRYAKAHYINTVVCSQTHHYILETCLSSCCIDTKPFKNCMVQRKLLEFQSAFALTDHPFLVKVNLNSNRFINAVMLFCFLILIIHLSDECTSHMSIYC